MIYAQIHPTLMDTILQTGSNELMQIYCYFYANLINKLSGSLIEQVQSTLKQCETSADERHIYLWTVLVKALVLSRPSMVDQYIPTVSRECSST